MIRSKQGFSLLELLIVVVILSIIVAIAIPSYLSHMQNEKLRYAKTQLSVMALEIEAKHVETGTYKNMKLADIGYASTDTEGNNYKLSNLSTSNFLLTVTIADNESCHVLTINAFNQRHAYSEEKEDTKADCW